MRVNSEQLHILHTNFSQNVFNSPIAYPSTHIPLQCSINCLYVTRPINCSWVLFFALLLSLVYL
ncbi:hypothetical protein GLYMA_18G251850v4 [Glycine max]|nr:hypothetical protein GLYMA_18G251850v4 [Glycine max]KAH1156098.1 hypothetical protein GYH30_051070 [Glycine max]